MLFTVRYEDSTGADSVNANFRSEDEAEKAIENELDQLKEYFAGRDYNYGDFWNNEGLTTEIWESCEKEYARWTRLWTAGSEDLFT